MTSPFSAVAAQAEFHHQFLMGLELMVATRETPDVMGDWMFRLFRRQHEEKFLSSFTKLGLDNEPHAVACAKYHVLSNGMGGVAVEYMEESSRKAWVRFRYPRWMYDGAVVCGIPVEASRGFLKGWYAQNGVSLKNPRLGFVCVSEDMTGQFGFCGYFKEYDHDLSEEERLQFAPGERPPAFDPDQQPKAPDTEWSEERLAKASRNYAVEYVRNGVRELTNVLGADRATELIHRAARLTGLQFYSKLAAATGARDGGPSDAGQLLATLFQGMGDTCTLESTGDTVTLTQTGLRIVRGLEGEERERLLAAWIELWRGVVHSHRTFMDLKAEPKGEKLVWTITLS